MTEALEALLNAHVAYELSRWRGPSLTLKIDSQIDEIFRWLNDVTLDELATREQILGVIDRYVIEVKVSGGITELMGELARLVFSSTSSANTTIAQVLSPASYDEFADKVLSLEAVGQELISLIAGSTALASITARVLSRALVTLLFSDNSGGRAARILGLTGIGERLRETVWPALERRIEEVALRILEQHRERIAQESARYVAEMLNATSMRALADEAWDTLSHMPLGQVYAFIGEQDLEDFVVLGYEFWLKLRKIPYFRTVLSEAVNYFFSKYGAQSVVALIEDMGVSATMVKGELNVFLGPLLERAAQTDFLEQQIRAHFEDFYRSPAAAAALAATKSADT